MIRWLADSPWRIDSLAFYCQLGCTSVQFRLLLLRLTVPPPSVPTISFFWCCVAFRGGIQRHLCANVHLSALLLGCLVTYLLCCLLACTAWLFWIGFELNSWICIWLPCFVCRLTGPLLRHSMPRHSRHVAFSRFPHGWHFLMLIFVPLFLVPHCECFYLAVCCLTNYADYLMWNF